MGQQIPLNYSEIFALCIRLLQRSKKCKIFVPLKKKIKKNGDGGGTTALILGKVPSLPMFHF